MDIDRPDNRVKYSYERTHVHGHTEKVLGKQMGKWVLTQCDRDETRKSK